MAKLMCIGRVTADLELRESARKEPYVRFSLAENLGYGETARTQYFQVWAWGHLAKNLVKRKVRKGSLIWVSGSLELEEYTRNNGETHDKRLKLKLGDSAKRQKLKNRLKRRRLACFRHEHRCTKHGGGWQNAAVPLDSQGTL